MHIKLITLFFKISLKKKLKNKGQWKKASQYFVNSKTKEGRYIRDSKTNVSLCSRDSKTKQGQYSTENKTKECQHFRDSNATHKKVIYSGLQKQKWVYVPGTGGLNKNSNYSSDTKTKECQHFRDSNTTNNNKIGCVFFF